MSESHPQGAPSEGGYEKRDLNPRAIALFSAGGAAVLLLAGALAFWMVRGADKRQAAPRPVLSPAPRLHLQGPDELRAMRAAEEILLNSYGWIDRESGIVRIPVERAMEIMAEKERSKAKVESKK